MTNEEAIRHIKTSCYLVGYPSHDKEYETRKCINEALDMAIKALEQQGNTWSLDDAREDFMYDVYNTLDFLPTNNEANRIIDSFDRVTSDIEQQPSEDKVTITMDKGTLKYSGKGYVVYNKDWFRKHFAMEVAIMTGYDGYIEQPYEEFCSLPPVTPTQSWIPVSEKLPKKNMPCLVSVGDFNLTQIAIYSNLMYTIDHKIFYQGDYGHDSFRDITKYVKAWMPLPKPYEEKRGSENEVN